MEDGYAYVYLDYETIHFTENVDLDKVKSHHLDIVNSNLDKGESPHTRVEVHIYVLEEDATEEFNEALKGKSLSSRPLGKQRSTAPNMHQTS